MLEIATEAPSPASTQAGKGPRLPKWLYVVAALAFAAGLCCIGISIASDSLGDGAAPLVCYWGLILGISLLYWSLRVFTASIVLRTFPEVRNMVTDVRTSMAALSQKAATDQRKGLAVSNPVTLFKEVKEAPDRIIFAPEAHPWLCAIILFLGIVFAAGGAMALQDAIAHSPARQAAQRIHLSKGERLPHSDSGLFDWAFGLGFVAVGGLMAIGGLYLVWTFHSLIVNPEKRELVRKITLRWPAWTITKSWQASDIECVYLDEHVTVWPGTPKFLRSIGNVEPSETSEGHVWIRLRTGKAVDCGKGAWEEASALAGRLGGLLGAPKTLRERFAVGPPPSNDTSS